MDLSHILLNEIALEGLDGITLETLWYRLNTTLPKFPLQLDDHSKAFLWTNIISRLKDVEFYTLIEERETVAEYVPEFAENGVEMYTPSRMISIYPCCYVEKDKKRGSCSTYDTRVDVTAEVRGKDRKAMLSYEEINTKWGRRLVAVASQTVRERVILQDATDPRMVKLTAEMYCLLEHIAKGRYAGIYGSDAFVFLQVMTSAKVTHGLMGYLRKKLKQCGVVAQASHLLMKSNSNYVRLNHENICYLRRMITPRTTVHGTFHQKIEEFLLTKPGRKYYVADMCVALHLDRRKVQKFLKLKSQHFDVMFVKGESLPSASTSPEVKVSTSPAVKVSTSPEEKRESCGSNGVSAENECSNDTSIGDMAAGGEEIEEVMESSPQIKPGGKRAKVTSSRAQLVVRLKNSQKEIEAEVESESDGEDTNLTTSVGEPRLRHVGMPMYLQVKEWIDQLGPEGATKTMLRDSFGLHTLQARTIMKRFHKFQSVHFFFTESKRQKVERMCSLEYASQHTHGVKQETQANVPNISSTNTATAMDTVPGVSVQDSPSKPEESVRQTTARQHITSKTAERHELVTGLAVEHKLILFPDLNKMVQVAEADKYNTTIDRKTLKRICEHLHGKKAIRIFKTCIEVDTKKRDLFYVCEPTMTLDNNLMRSSLESQRSDLTSTSKLVVKEPKQEAGNGSNKKGKQMEECELIYEPSTENLKKYGYAAKMKRIETLHKFLSYVVYNHEGCKEEADEEQFESADGDVSKLKVYCDVTDWRRFLPPKILSPHKDSEGKACVIDLGTQLPLVLFLVLVKLPYDVPAVVEYLDDPIKRLIPVRHLPTSMQAPLLHRRKYLSALKEIVSMICMMGIATNISTAEGGITFREISLIYLHKTAAFVDTTEGLLTKDMAEEEIKNKKHIYSVNKGMFEVDEYWMALRNICTATPVKRLEKGKAKSLDEPEILRPELLKDVTMKEVASPKTLDQVQEGFIPGDGKGAGGLHTLFHSNLNRLWHSYFEKVIPSTAKLTVTNGKLCKDGQRQLFLTDSQMTVRPTIVPIKSNSECKLNSKAKTAGRKRGAPEQKSLVKKIRFDMGTVAPAETPEKITHTAQRRKRNYEARRAKDAKDYIAEAHLETQRSIFTPQEDEALMLAKIGLNILGCKEVASKPIRDFLHKHLPNQARDKSSSSCWARMNRILQFNMRERALHLYTSIAMNDPEIAKYKDQEPAVASSKFASTYNTLMDLVLRKCGDAADSEVAIDLSTVGGLDDLISRYNLIMVAETTETIRENTGHAHTHKVSPPVEVSYRPPESDTEIVKYTLSNFTLAYLLINDKMSRTFTMHKVFEQYPSNVADAVLLDLQVNKVATLRKSSTTRTVRRFGLTYKHKLFTERLQIIARDIFESCGKAYTELENWTEGDYEFTDVDDWRGHLIMLLTLFPSNAIDIKFDLPEKVLDTSNVQPSDDEEDDEEDDDLVEDNKAASAKDKRCRMRFEHCQIKPCAIRACLKPGNMPSALNVTRKQDRDLARRLMSTVPYPFVSEEVLEKVKMEATDSDRPILSSTYNLIENAGITGISLLDLFNNVTITQNCTMSSLVQLLDVLVDSSLVLCVGITHRVYVTYSNSRTWVVHSLRDTKGRGSGVELSEDDKVRLSEENPADDGFHSISPPPEAMPQPSTTHHRVDIIPKPWLTTEGTVNYEILYQILTSLVSTINKHQSIKFDSLHRLVCMVYSPVLLLDLLKILEDLGCVRCDYLTPSSNKRPSLFSKRITYKLSNDWPQPNSIAHYTVNHEAMHRISLFMRNTSQKHGAS